LFILVDLERIEPPFTSALKEHPPRCPLLDGKIIRVKLKKNIIITSKTIYGTKTFVGFWNTMLFR